MKGISKMKKFALVLAAFALLAMYPLRAQHTPSAEAQAVKSGAPATSEAATGR